MALLHFAVVCLAPLLQGTSPASAPSAPLLPSAIRPGDDLSIPLTALGGEGHVLRLAAKTNEPLTILAESVDADVSLAVEDASGAVLATDDDGGTETSAWLVLTPSAAGTLHVRLRAKQTSQGAVRIAALRGAIESTPSDPVLGAIGFWEIALDRAHASGNPAREALAVERLLALRGLADEVALRAARAPRDEARAKAIALGAQARTLRTKGDQEGARSAMREAALLLRNTPGSFDDERIARLGWTLAISAHESGDAAASADLLLRSFDYFERAYPAHHPDRTALQRNLVIALASTGDNLRARTVMESLLASRELTHPATHPETVAARQFLGILLDRLGDARAALRLEERSFEQLARSLPDAHADLLTARQRLAERRRALGDLAGARSVLEPALVAAAGTLSEDHELLFTLRRRVAELRRDTGDLVGARALLEAQLAIVERTRPKEDHLLFESQDALAGVLLDLGDRPRARVLMESVLREVEVLLPPESKGVQQARLNLATVLDAMADLDGARSLREKALAVLERTVPEDDADLVIARQAMARSLRRAGQLGRARGIQETLVESLERTRSSGDALLQSARQGLAGTLRQQGQLVLARALEERVLRESEPVLPPEHPDLAISRHNLAVTLFLLGDEPALAAQLDAILREGESRVRSSAALSPRETLELAASMEDILGLVLSLAPSTRDPGRFAARAFGWAETRRALAASGASWSREAGADEEVASRLADSRSARSAVAGVAARRSGPSGAAAAQALEAAVARRDEAERSLREALVRRGAMPPDVDAALLARKLAPSEAAVGYLRVLAHERYPGVEGALAHVDRFLAHVLRPDGTLVRVDLGAADALRAAVETWRASLGVEEGARGAGGVAAGGAAERPSAGEALRRLVVDPVLAASGGAKSWVVCLDDALHLVPLDALPLGEGVVGDRITVRVEASFDRLQRPRPARAAVPTLLALGGVDYDGEPSPPRAGASAVAAPALTRGADAARFEKLPATASEVREIAASFRSVFDVDAVLLEGGAATKEAFAEATIRAGFVHVATHGFFGEEERAPEAPTAAPGERAAADDSWHEMTLGDARRTLSPMALCGIVLAGANRGLDTLGRAPGILTAEELAGLDLRSCELAVLSACETSLGVARPGLGVASLQAALHAAGVRTAITSLWKVDDERTRELMVDFYRRLWIEKQPVATALWSAKKAARAKGWPLRDWSGWVLTGDPGDEPHRTAAGTPPANR